jgi:hypothetical protein
MTQLIQGVIRTQRIEGQVVKQSIKVDPIDKSVRVFSINATPTVVLAGPQGPRGLSGAVEYVEGVDEQFVDEKIATHNQSDGAHPGSSSGRDFSALFQNGLI